MTRIIAFFLFFSLLSCGPKITRQITKKYPALNYRQEVQVFGLTETAPEGEELGTIKVGDTGFTTNCNYDVVIDKAKLEARKAGGNAIQVIEHKTPSFSSTCHRITALVLKIDEAKLALTAPADPVRTLGDVDYAILHVYRFGGVGAAVGYDLYLGDSVICRVKNNSRQSIRIYKDGRNMLWAKTESKAEVPVNIQFGNEYFLRCSVTMGVMVGRPSMQLVEYRTGKAEIESVKVKTKK